MNNKTMLFMAEFHEAILEFISMDVGKSVKADLKAIRDAHGGAKKLAEADRILGDAKKGVTKITSDALERANKINRDSEIVLVAANVENCRVRDEILELQRDLDTSQRAAAETARKQKEEAEALYDRETAVSDAEDANWTKEHNLKAMETRLTAQKQELDARAKRMQDAAA